MRASSSTRRDIAQLGVDETERLDPLVDSCYAGADEAAP